MFPQVMDNTMLSTGRACPKKFYWNNIRKLTPKVPSIHLTAGGAFAKGLEVARRAFYVDQLPESQAISLGLQALWRTYGEPDVIPNPKKDWERMSTALVDYLTHYRLADDYIKPKILGQERAIEFSFAVPLPIDNPDTGEEILLAGRCDMIGEYNKGIFVVDEKTTGSLSSSWKDQWVLSSQPLTYMWAARQYGWNVVGTFIRGVGILSKEIRHAEVILPYRQWLVDQWYAQTLRTIDLLIECYKTNAWDMSFGIACTSYAGCAFKRLCEKRDPEPWVRVDFTHNDWSPLKQKETT